jgi:hypothetical protein
MYVITTIIVICIVLLVLHGFYLSYLEGLKEDVKWSCFLGQFYGFAKMHLVYVHAAFRVSLCSKYAASGVRLSRAV